MSRQATWRAIAAVCCAGIAFSAAARIGDDGDHSIAEHQYAAARAAAESGDIGAAEDHLRAAVRAGFLDFSAMQRDPLLAPLRDRPVMRAMLAARDSADDLLSRRRIDEWQERLSRSRYAMAHDEERLIDLLAGGRSCGPQAAVLATIRETMDALAGSIFPARLPHRVLIIILEVHDAAIFLPHPNARGKYLHSQRLILAADAGRALRHELAHALHHAHMDALGQEHAMWVQEGLASLFESMAQHGISASAAHEGHSLEFEANERDAIAEMMIERGRAMALDAFFAIDAGEFERDGVAHYAQARSIMSFLHESNLLEAWYAEYCANFEEDSTGARAMERVFDGPLEVIEQNWSRWVADGGGRDRAGVVLVAGLASRTEMTRANPAADESETESREAVEAMYQRIRPRMLHEYREAIPHLREVVAIDPGHAAARYDLGLALIFVGDLEGAEAEWAALDRFDRNLASLLKSAMRNRECLH